MAAFSSVSEKNCSFRKAAVIQVDILPSLSAFHRQTIFDGISRIETDDIMMCLDFSPAFILAERMVHGFALFSESVGITVDSFEQIFISGNIISLVIQNRFVGKFIMLHRQVIDGISIIGVADFYVLNSCHDTHLPFL